MKRTTLIAVLAAAGACLSACASHAPGGKAVTERAEANRRTVLEYYEKGLNQKDAEAALQYVGEQYLQHNPLVADGREGFRQFIQKLRQEHPQSHSEVKRSFVDGDYVILHVHGVRDPGTRGNAIVDIFRLDRGKIVEHWDAIQPIPETTASGRPMF